MKQARLAVLLFGLVASLHADGRLARYALILDDASLAEQITSRKELTNAASLDRLSRIESAQRNVSAQLQSRGLHVLGANQILVNAVFVLAPEDQLGTLSTLAGVKHVVKLRPLKRSLNTALDLTNVPAAWSALGGSSNAGTGVKIGILDSGIDQNHPGFQDPSLTAPSGFPKCAQSDCAYTNGKVIVARSYVQQLNFIDGTDPSGTRPDDYSPRDRVGHGTAVAMVAAGVRNTGPLATITGVAPKAWIGNYKIYGSPGVNDIAFPDVVIKALTDALTDGMDIVNLSFGQNALCAPDIPAGGICGNDNDILSPAVENAIRSGLTVVVAAGNEGLVGSAANDNSIQSPGTAPSAITVGATFNSHALYQTVTASGPGVTADLQTINTYFGNGPKLNQALTAPLGDAGKVGDQFACSPLPAGSLTGKVALVRRGTCARATKANNAQAAGAIAMILYQDAGDYTFRMLAMENTGVPSVLIGNQAGQKLKDLLTAGNAINVKLDPAWRVVDDRNVDFLTDASSRGPSIGASLIKPEIVAPGANIYTATQNYDPNGENYDVTGYVSAEGTSISAAFVAGAAALVKQKNPSFTPAQIKSALVNTANNAINDFDAIGNPVRARIASSGNGKLDAAAALNTTVTFEPATLSFGIANPLPSKNLTFRNTGSSNVTVRFNAAPASQGSTQVELSSTSLTLGPGALGSITVKLSGSVPAPGAYQGYITADTGQQTMRIPYLYLIGDGVPYNILPLQGYEFVGTAGGQVVLTLKVTDQYGVPVAGAPVRFRAVTGGGRIGTATPTTDELGIAETGQAFLGSSPGEQSFAVDVGNLSYTFSGVARSAPSLTSAGIVNAASGQAGPGIAPGSYISIYGSALSDAFQVYSTPYLPVSLSNVSVSFDNPSKNISVPGRLQFVTSGQINVQVPWELQGAGNVSIKVSTGPLLTDSSTVIQVPVVDAAPAAFEYPDNGRTLAAALDENFKLISSSNPVAKGHVAQIYVNGLGAVDSPVPSGEPTPTTQLYRTKLPATVTVAGQDAQVLFSGLAPGIVGLYQINILVPTNVPSGIQSVVITSNGIASKQTSLAIQ